MPDETGVGVTASPRWPTHGRTRAAREGVDMMGFFGIADSMVIEAGDGLYGHGVYLTDIPPDGLSDELDLLDLSITVFGVPNRSEHDPRTEHFFELMLDSDRVFLAREHIYVVPDDVHLAFPPSFGNDMGFPFFHDPWAGVADAILLRSGRSFD